MINGTKKIVFTTTLYKVIHMYYLSMKYGEETDQGEMWVKRRGGVD